MNWDDPVARLHLIESVGIKEYNRMMAEHIQKEVISVVNGHCIRPVSTRFGRLFMVSETSRAFTTKEEAENYAETLK